MGKLSIIIPFYNEAPNVHHVLTEVTRHCPQAELIAVDDGSSDDTPALLRQFNHIKRVTLPRNLGQSAALYAGLQSATGDICVLMDGDGQNNPADIPRLVAALSHADLVCGVRQHRQDPLKIRLASKAANHIRRQVLGDSATDTGCTLKAFRRVHGVRLPPFNGLHRFLPAFFEHAGLTLLELPVDHRPRHAGTSHYTIKGRALRGALDLVGVKWLLLRQLQWSTPPWSTS